MLFIFSWMNYDIGDNESALMYALFGIGIIAFSIIYSRFLKPAHDKASRDKILDWIFEHRDVLTKGSTRFGLDRVDSKTILTRYCIVFSFGFFTQKKYTNYVIKDSNKSIFVGIATTLSNLIVGWWGLPWGPIYTVQSVYNNAFNKELVSVGNIIEFGLSKNNAS